MTVIPLFCSRFLKACRTRITDREGATPVETAPWGALQCRVQSRFYGHCSISTSVGCGGALRVPALTVALLIGLFVVSLGIYPFLGRGVLPANRRRAVHHQPQGRHRNARSK